MNRHKGLRYGVYDTIIRMFWGHRIVWNYYRHKWPDQYAEDMADAVGCYCMGGEL